MLNLNHFERSDRLVNELFAPVLIEGWSGLRSQSAMKYSRPGLWDLPKDA